MSYDPLTSAAPTNDVSISMAMAENGFIILHEEVKEYVVKFLFRPNSSSNNTKVARTHYNIPHCITQIYPEAQVFDRIVMAMASSSAMVTTYSGATQKSVRMTESEDGGFLALLLNPLTNILVAKLLNPVLTPGD